MKVSYYVMYVLMPPVCSVSNTLHNWRSFGSVQYIYKSAYYILTWIAESVLDDHFKWPEFYHSQGLNVESHIINPNGVL
jgi:hypothetical protein